jgi:phage shock protein B
MEALAIIFGAAICITWMSLHYVTMWKKDKIISPEDGVNLSEIRRVAERLEERLKVMERILDSEIPDWRSKQ